MKIHKGMMYMLVSEMKICKECNTELPKSKEYFHINSERKDGFSTKCKQCALRKEILNFNIFQWYESRTNKFKINWTYDDIKWLYDNYLKLEKQELLSYFNYKIKYKTITNLVYQWGLRKKEKNEDWSEEDIEFLIKNYPNMSQFELQEKFNNRTWHSIKMKASKLKVHRDSDTLFNINSEAHKGFIHSKESKKKMSIGRSGENNPFWKGGITPIVVRLREYTIPWKLESLKSYDFKCALSGINDGTLEVHHLNKNFSEIIYEVFTNLNIKIHNDMSNYTDKEIMLIKENIVKYHFYYGLGIPLTKKLHNLFHKQYGLKNNTYEQFEEFKNNYINGAYKDVV